MRTFYKEPRWSAALTDKEYVKEFEQERFYHKEPVYNCEPEKKSSVYCVSSRLSTSGLLKHYFAWQSIINGNMGNPDSIIRGNMNIRKIEMVLMMRAIWKNPISKYGRTQFIPEVRHYIFKKFNFRCVDCGATNKETTLHIDHIKPISVGGTNNEDNLQVLCKKCNIAKHTNEWVGGQ